MAGTSTDYVMLPMMGTQGRLVVVVPDPRVLPRRPASKVSNEVVSERPRRVSPGSLTILTRASVRKVFFLELRKGHVAIALASVWHSSIWKGASGAQPFRPNQRGASCSRLDVQEPPAAEPLPRDGLRKDTPHSPRSLQALACTCSHTSRDREQAASTPSASSGATPPSPDIRIGEQASALGAGVGSGA